MKAKSNNYRGKVDISVSQNFITSKNTIDIDNVKENVIFSQVQDNIVNDFVNKNISLEQIIEREMFNINKF